MQGYTLRLYALCLRVTPPSAWALPGSLGKNSFGLPLLAGSAKRNVKDQYSFRYKQLYRCFPTRDIFFTSMDGVSNVLTLFATADLCIK